MNSFNTEIDRGKNTAAQCCDKVYFCPTSGDTECPVHGGFDVCCDRPDLHRPVASAASPHPSLDEWATWARENLSEEEAEVFVDQAKTREVFSVADVRVGDLIEYPARLRREHKGVRSRLLVEAVEGRTLRTDGGIVTPTQIEENGVLVYGD